MPGQELKLPAEKYGDAAFYKAMWTQSKGKLLPILFRWGDMALPLLNRRTASRI